MHTRGHLQLLTLEAFLQGHGKLAGSEHSLLPFLLLFSEQKKMVDVTVDLI